MLFNREGSQFSRQHLVSDGTGNYLSVYFIISITFILKNTEIVMNLVCFPFTFTICVILCFGQLEETADCFSNPGHHIKG